MASSIAARALAQGGSDARSGTPLVEADGESQQLRAQAAPLLSLLNASSGVGRPNAPPGAAQLVKSGGRQWQERLRLESSTVRVGEYEIACAATQGGRPYMEDCFAVHELSIQTGAQRVPHADSGSSLHVPFAVGDTNKKRAVSLQQLSNAASNEVNGSNAAPGLILCQVYDGHGGRETARFASLHMAEHVCAALQQRQAAFLAPASPSSPHTTLQLEQIHAAEALRAAVCNFDRSLADPKHKPELYQLSLPPESKSTASTPRSQMTFGKFENNDGEPAEPITPVATAPGLRQRHGAQPFEVQEEEGGGVMQGVEQPQQQPPSPPQQQLPSDPKQPASPPHSYGRLGVGANAEDYVGPTAGSTALLALLAPGQLLVVAGVGDSKAWMCTDRAQPLRPMSVEHKPTDAGERNRIIKAGGWVSNSGRLNSDLDMSRSLGDMEFKQAKNMPPDQQAVIATPDVVCVRLDGPKEQRTQFLYLLLCTDGLSNVIGEAQMNDFVLAGLDAGESPETIAKDLCSLACVAPNTVFDNVTVLLVVPCKSG